MKTIKHYLISTFIFLLLINMNGFSQGKHGGSHGNKNNRNHGNQVKRNLVIKPNYYKQQNKRYYNRSAYRPHNFHNYRPIWAHHHNYNRRWIYFPQQNFYYDNWRQVYFYRTNNRWQMNAALPSSFVIINLEDERHYELADDEDDMDRIYINNNKHFSLFDLNIIVK